MTWMNFVISLLSKRMKSTSGEFARVVSGASLLLWHCLLSQGVGRSKTGAGRLTGAARPLLLLSNQL